MSKALPVSSFKNAILIGKMAPLIKKETARRCSKCFLYFFPLPRKQKKEICKCQTLLTLNCIHRCGLRYTFPKRDI